MLLDEYPHSDRFQLTKDGRPAEKVCLPVHVHKYEWALLSGRGNARELEEMLAPEDLDLNEMVPSSGLNVGIFAIDYQQSDVGQLKEYYLIVAARDRPLKRTTSEARSGFFVWDIQLDSDLAIRYGRQVWGHPKTACAGTAGFDAKNFAFRFREKSGEAILWGKVDAATDLSYSFVRFPSFFFITPYEIRRSWAEAINEGDSASKAFEPGVDEFGWNPETRLGSKLSRIGFEPAHWTLGRNMAAVGLR